MYPKAHVHYINSTTEKKALQFFKISYFTCTVQTIFIAASYIHLFFFFFHNTTVDSSDICIDCPTLNILTKKVGGGGWTCSDFQTPLLFYGNWEFHVTGVGEPPPYYNRPNLWSTKHLLSNALNYHIQIHLHNIFLYP